MMQDFHSNNKDLESLTISIYTLGYCIGPLIIAPISEVYGRIWLLRAAYVIFPLALAVCASSRSLALFIVFRAIMGFAGIIFVLLGPAVVPDIMAKERRGFALSVMSTGASLGPTLGPIMGGFIVERTSWRWTLWSCTIALGVLAVLAFCILKETYGQVLKEREEKKTKETRTSAIRRPFTVQLAGIFKGPWMRPVRMLTHSPIVLLFALYTTVTQGYLLLVLATLGLLFQDQYNFSPEASGLAYLGMTLGFVFSQIGLGHFSDTYVSKIERKHGVHKPEYRLPPLLLGALIIPAGLFCYGWGTHTHWIMPIIGSALFAVGFMYTYLPALMYLVDAYAQYAASAIGACTVVRSICAAILPLAAGPLYDRLGYDWGNSLLAFIALAFVPFAIVLAKYGERIRLRFQPEL
ncbi:MFS general substrate transporter [Glonium stellatum]|uniref:MFS general substrate transporter n=1 Tax=Glonium stellatum TaxID=574774 RepID=A0A8E2EXI8_9PEZI|nr:MFS general substrate transporter [Glonium stellatum]